MANAIQSITIQIPQDIWQSLVSMAAEDLRGEEEFLVWLIYRESRLRGFTLSEIGGKPLTTLSERKE